MSKIIVSESVARASLEWTQSEDATERGWWYSDGVTSDIVVSGTLTAESSIDDVIAEMRRVGVIDHTTSTQYEVEKFGRAMDGKWFGFGPVPFRSLGEARSHFEHFAAQQRDVLCNGVRIDLRMRKGRRVIATVGGRLHNATVIRVLNKTIYICSREVGAIAPTHREVYAGALSARALKARLTRERAGGDRDAWYSFDDAGEAFGADDALRYAQEGDSAKIRCRIDSVGFPIVGAVDRNQVADTLGWNPTGEAVARVWTALCQGTAVEALTAQIPRHRAAGGDVTTVTFFPLLPNEDGAAIPASGAHVVRFAGPK